MISIIISFTHIHLQFSASWTSTPLSKLFTLQLGTLPAIQLLLILPLFLCQQPHPTWFYLLCLTQTTNPFSFQHFLNHPLTQPQLLHLQKLFTSTVKLTTKQLTDHLNQLIGLPFSLLILLLHARPFMTLSKIYSMLTFHLNQWPPLLYLPTPSLAWPPKSKRKYAITGISFAKPKNQTLHPSDLPTNTFAMKYLIISLSPKPVLCTHSPPQIPVVSGPT